MSMLRFLILLIILVPLNSYAEMEIPHEKALNIAQIKANELGCDINVMEVEIYEYTTPWNNLLPKDSESEYVLERQKKLKNKSYYLIYFFHNIGDTNIILGGDLGIFVEKSSGEILSIYRGK